MKSPSWLDKLVWKWKFSSEEWFETYDESGRPAGTAPRSILHDGKSFLLHKVVHLIVLDLQGRFLLQKRALSKDIQPGKWDTSVGGHVGMGEIPFQALVREAYEELFIPQDVVAESKFLYSYRMRSAKEYESVDTFLLRTGHMGFRFQESEIDEIRFWSVEELEQNLGRGCFTPNFEDEYLRFKQTPEYRRFFS
jgi:isopentenyldiphosphate isomerase